MWSETVSFNLITILLVAVHPFMLLKPKVTAESHLYLVPVSI